MPVPARDPDDADVERWQTSGILFHRVPLALRDSDDARQRGVADDDAFEKVLRKTCSRLAVEQVVNLELLSSRAAFSNCLCARAADDQIGLESSDDRVHDDAHELGPCSVGNQALVGEFRVNVGRA